MQAKAVIAGIICICSSSYLHAEYDIEKLQKLFTNKNQRDTIDAARSGHDNEPELQKIEKVKLSGYMTRSDGKSVVWVNDKNTLEQTRVDNIKVQQAGIGKNNKVGLTVDGKHVHLKPGETWYTQTGKIVDNQ